VKCYPVADKENPPVVKRHLRIPILLAAGAFTIAALSRSNARSEATSADAQNESPLAGRIAFHAAADLRASESAREAALEPALDRPSKAAAVEQPAGSSIPKPGPSMPKPPPRSRLITLEQAYDIALASDQAIRNAYVALRNAQLEPWSALTRVAPQITGQLNYEVIRERRFYNPTDVYSAPLATTPDTAPLVSSGDPETAGSQVSKDPTPGIAGTVIPDFPGTHNYTRRATAVIQQPLLDLTVFPAWRFGKLSVATADLRRKYLIRETLFGVARAYYAVLKAQAIVQVNRETLTLAAEQLEVARRRFSLGDVARSDELRAQSVMEVARRALIESQGLLEVNQNTLANILNLDWDTDFRVTDPTELPVLHESYPALLASAFQRREDFRASAFGIDQRVELRKEVIAQYAPRVVAQAQHDWTDVTTNTSNLNSQRIWTAVVAVQVPFFTGGQREIDLHRTANAIERAKNDHESLAKSIQSEVKQAWVEVRTLRESVLALNAEVKSAEAAYEDLTAGYREGTATSLDVAAGLRERNNARATLAGSRFDYQVALRNVQRAAATFQSERVRNSRAK
jgi:outer membrane protein